VTEWVWNRQTITDCSGAVEVRVGFCVTPWEEVVVGNVALYTQQLQHAWLTCYSQLDEVGQPCHSGNASNGEIKTTCNTHHAKVITKTQELKETYI